MGKTLLLISKSSEDKAFAAEVAMAAGLSLQVTRDPREGAASIANDEATVIFADASSEASYRSVEEAIQDAVGLFSDKINANKFHFVCTEPASRCNYLMQSPLFGHYILRRYGDVSESGPLYGRLVKTTSEKRAFGTAQLLKDGTDVQKIQIRNTNQKFDAVDAIRDYLVQARFQGRMATVISNAIDDLLSFSIFDAPVDDLGKATHAQLPRSSFLELSGKNAVEMNLGFDGKHFVVTVTDLYGSLDKMKILTSIARDWSDEELRPKSNSYASMGIGLAQATRAGGSIYLVSESHGKTEITLFFKRCLTFKEFRQQFKFISTQFYF